MERNRFRVAPSARLPNDEEQLVDNVEEMADAEVQAINSGATNDGVGGATNAADVDSTGDPIIQSVGVASIPSNRAAGGSQTQFGIQSYGIVRASGPNNAAIRQNLVQERQLAQSTYVNSALAPVEDYDYAYQAPIPGYTPYYYGVYA